MVSCVDRKWFGTLQQNILPPMFQKENNPPTKQGVMYELNLDKQQGPFLNKDIMHSNPRSITLLAGSQIMNSFTSLNQTLKLTQAKQKQYNFSLSSIESFAATVKSIEDEIQINLSLDKKLKLEERQLRSEIYYLNEAIVDTNMSLLDEYLPLLKGLHRVVKEQASLQKEEVFRMERELKSMAETKRQILEGVFKCEEKIVAIEASFGLQNKQKLSSSN